MIGKILSHLLGNAGEESEVANDAYDQIMEFEEEGWVVVHLPENEPLSDVDPLENLLIEHPSMSVYQMRCRMGGEEEEEELVSEDEDAPRPVAVRRLVSWHLGVPLPCGVQLLAVQRARSQAERRKLSRGALQRQNLAKCRSPGERRLGYFKQPCQRLYSC
ncbi:tumor protein p53-inducible nuclear protein 2 [Cololabis saira]|uniref:tumor protein p53-inducible nuclear protein 2 n=1 Tax=Cololabis saira TaxID=129043 RepID=UPI002AD5219D|nr:tumor protein p53-inducible nuclear protein 2 [Cololabis saira]